MLFLGIVGENEVKGALKVDFPEDVLLSVPTLCQTRSGASKDLCPEDSSLLSVPTPYLTRQSRVRRT